MPLRKRFHKCTMSTVEKGLGNLITKRLCPIGEEKIMASVELKNVTKKYPNGFVAVKDFNLDIKDKEFIIFVGPSGCGKSTTLRMIAGLEDISSGDLIIDGKRVNDVEPKDRDIAMVFQNYALYPHMTVYDNMSFGLKLRKVPKAEIDKLVHEAAKILGIEQLLDRKPKALSGGQRQRVAMGRAIVRNPKVFLMDEPLSNLDAKLRVQMRIEIQRLHQRLQATIIYVTHDQTEAMTLGTRIVVLKDGVIQQGYSIQKAYDISQIRTKQPEEAEPKPMDQLMEALLTDSEVRIQIADNLPDKVQAQYIPNKRTIYVRNGMSKNATFHSISRELACASLDHHDGSYSRAGVSAQAYCAAYVTAQKYGVDVSGFSFDKVCQMQAFGQKDPKELRSFIQDVKSAAYSIGKQVDRNLGKSEQEFMTDEFAIPEEKTEKPAKSKKSPER